MSLDPPASAARRRAVSWLIGGFGLFVVAIALLLAPGFVHPPVPFYLPTPPGAELPPASVVTDTVTVDAGREGRWRYFTFARGAVTDPPDTAGWDLAFRRFHVVSSGDIANLGRVPFDQVLEAPDTGYVPTAFDRDTVNRATAHWYRYSYFSHLLSPVGDVYVVRTRSGRFVRMEILSYYCPGPTPGCLTFRYTFDPDGGRHWGPE